MSKNLMITGGCNMVNLEKVACSLLYNLDHIEKKSPHTLLAYSNDLSQCFQKSLKNTHFVGPKIDGTEIYCLKNEQNTPLNELISAEELVQQSSEFLKSISHLEPATRSRKVATLRRFFKHLKENSWIERIPSFLVSPKKAIKIPHFISVDESIAVLNVFSRKNLEPKEREHFVLFLLLYGSGLRISEACNVQWNHIDLQRRQIRVKGKGQKTRLISFPTILGEQLLFLKNVEHVYVWGDRPLNVRTAYNMIRHCGHQAHLSKPLNPHALRHSFATHLLNDGADLRIIQELLGHSSLATTEKYTHIHMEQLTQTMETFHPLNKKVAI